MSINQITAKELAMSHTDIFNEIAETLPTFVPELQEDQARVEVIARQLAEHLTTTLTNMNFDPFLDQLAAIYDELDRLPKTAELREALTAVSDLGILLDLIQHS